MLANLELAQKTVQQNKDHTQNLHKTMQATRINDSKNTNPQPLSG